MSNKDHPATASPRKRLLPIHILAIVSVVVASLLFVFVVTRDHDRDTRAFSDEGSLASSTSSVQTTTSLELETELTARLRDILAKREAAYNQRDPEILNRIYTVDCPCLKSDSNAIRELINEDYVWVGGETTIDVQRMERVTERMWIIVANFTSGALRIETESGDLVRAEPRGSDLFQFVLARPVGSTQWLLGRASSYESG